MTFRTMSPRSFACAFAVAMSMLALGSSAAFPQAIQTVRVRGSVVSLEGTTLTVKTRQGGDVMIKLADNFRIASVVKASIADIKPGVFIGTASVVKKAARMRSRCCCFPKRFAARARETMLGISRPIA